MCAQRDMQGVPRSAEKMPQLNQMQSLHCSCRSPPRRQRHHAGRKWHLSAPALADTLVVGSSRGSQVDVRPLLVSQAAATYFLEQGDADIEMAGCVSDWHVEELCYRVLVNCHCLLSLLGLRHRRRGRGGGRRRILLSARRKSRSVLEKEPLL